MHYSFLSLLHYVLFQGKVQLWVDIFPKDEGTPKPPVVIDERKPVKYVQNFKFFNIKTLTVHTAMLILSKVLFCVLFNSDHFHAVLSTLCSSAKAIMYNNLVEFGILRNVQNSVEFLRVKC